MKMKMKLTSLFSLMIILMNVNVKAQSNENSMNFWVGKWHAYWADSLRGTNDITKTLGEKVVEENFISKDGTFSGRSWSVFDSASNSWRQTWVDNTGAYLTFTGGREMKM